MSLAHKREKSSLAGAVSAPKAEAPPTPKPKSRAKSKKRNEPPPPPPGHNSVVDTTLSKSPDDQVTHTKIYIDEAIQVEHQDVTEERETQTDRHDTTREKATQTDHQDVARSAALQPPSYSDPTERWVMAEARSGQTAALDAPRNDNLSGEITIEGTTEIESMRGPPAEQPFSSQRPRRSRRKNQDDPAANVSGSSTAQETGSVSGPYKKPNFTALLEVGSSTKVQLFMNEYTEVLDTKGVDDATRDLLKGLKAESHLPGTEERYQEEVLQLTMEQLEFKNEPYVVAELHDLVCPPVERLSHIHDRNIELRGRYKLFVDQRNEGWTKAPQLLAGFPSPKPDYCVGYRRRAFTREELALLATVPSSRSSFAVTDHMYFPFLTCEVKSHKEPISIANRQNAYSMMVAVSTAVGLFRAAKVEQSVHRKVLGFSISYDHKNVVAFGYYPVIDGPCTEIYRTCILDFTITSGGSTKWHSWHFVRNVYEVWAPAHLDRLRAAIELIKTTAYVARDGSRDKLTPTPSESANRGLQQLNLKSPRPQQLAREDSGSVASEHSRRRRAASAPAGADASPKRRK
ncbi:hypothetical protein SLS56_009385 [Neofusicoccum ribis]|uniref:DUF7924 domain-containing protein n=1 Tax=Neofusicoccum ribis TaxID=45134 RepID=A0ABR3SIW6_9PEZI